MKFFSRLLPNSIRQWILSGVGLLALIAFAAFVMFDVTKADVTLSENGEKQTMTTHADTVQELLNEAGISYSKHDALSHDIDAPVKDGMTITYDAANQITVSIDGDEQVYYTTTDQINAFLDEKDINVSDHDDTSHEKSAAIKDGMTYSIERAFQVTINDGGEEKDVWTTGGTVADILEDNDIAWNDSDQLNPGEDEDVTKDTPITITHVDKETDEVEETIDYKVEEQKDDTLEKGKENVIAEGQEGVLVKTYEITKENGKEVNRELIDEDVKQESEKRIVAIGTKEEDQEPDQEQKQEQDQEPEQEQNLTKVSNESNNSNDEDGKVLQMDASAYTIDCLGCNGNGKTATGINLQENPNVVAVDPSVIPLGSTVRVEGYGTAVAGDTGGDIVGNRIDLHFDSKSEANRFGRQTVEVKVLD